MPESILRQQWDNDQNLKQFPEDNNIIIIIKIYITTIMDELCIYLLIISVIDYLLMFGKCATQRTGSDVQTSPSHRMKTRDCL